MRIRDYSSFNKPIADNITIYIQNHPDAVEAFLFRANHDLPEQTAVTTDVVGAIESNERSLTYQPPLYTKIVILPDQMPFMAADVGGGPDGNMEQPVVLLIGDADVPKQSVIQYEEYESETETRSISLYVVRSEGMGEAPGVGLRHYCLPFFSLGAINPPHRWTADDGVDSEADGGIWT